MDDELFRPFRPKKTNTRQMKSHAKETHRNLLFVSHIFFLYGLDLGLLNRPRCVLFCFMRTFCIFYNIYSLIVLLFTICTTDYSYMTLPIMKIYIVLYVSSVTKILLWFIINMFKKQLRYLFLKIKKQQIHFQIEFSNLFHVFTIFWPSIMQIIFFIAEILPFNRITYKNFIDGYSFHLLDSSKYNSYYFYYVMTFIWVAFSKTFVICVILLYILICSHFKKVIMKYTVENMEISLSKRVSNERVASRFHKYESVLNTMKMFESIMKVPIFLSFSFSVVEAFYGMLTLMKTKEINKKKLH